MPALAEQLIGLFKLAHERALVPARGLDGAQLYHRPDGTNSIGWNLWHVARFADLVRYELLMTLPTAGNLGPARQLWDVDELAGRWGLDPAQLGRWQTGWEMPEAVAHAFRPPAGERPRP
jgi:hypothetical protein